jgi:hypothetical protein
MGWRCGSPFRNAGHFGRRICSPSWPPLRVMGDPSPLRQGPGPAGCPSEASSPAPWGPWGRYRRPGCTARSSSTPRPRRPGPGARVMPGGTGTRPGPGARVMPGGTGTRPAPPLNGCRITTTTHGPCSARPKPHQGRNDVTGGTTSYFHAGTASRAATSAAVWLSLALRAVDAFADIAVELGKTCPLLSRDHVACWRAVVTDGARRAWDSLHAGREDNCQLGGWRAGTRMRAACHRLWKT